jgi:hypothetical protein
MPPEAVMLLILLLIVLGSLGGPPMNTPRH